MSQTQSDATRKRRRQSDSPPVESIIQQIANLALHPTVTPMSTIGVSKVPEYGLAVVEWYVFDGIKQADIIEPYNLHGYGNVRTTDAISNHVRRYGPAWYKEQGVRRPWKLYTKKEQEELRAAGFGAQDFPFIHPREQQRVQSQLDAWKSGTLPTPGLSSNVGTPSWQTSSPFSQSTRATPERTKASQSPESAAARNNMGEYSPYTHSEDSGEPPAKRSRSSSSYYDVVGKDLMPALQPCSPSPYFGYAPSTPENKTNPVSPYYLSSSSTPESQYGSPHPEYSEYFSATGSPLQFKGEKPMYTFPLHPKGDLALDMDELKTAYRIKFGEWQEANQVGIAEMSDLVELELDMIRTQGMDLDKKEWTDWINSGIVKEG